MSVELVMPSNHLILCHPLLLLPSIFPRIRVFSKVLALYSRWPKYWSFGFIISPSSEYSGLISFRMDWLDLLAVQGTLKSFLQHHSSNHLFFSANAFYCPTLTSIHVYWKNRSFDYAELCRQIKRKHLKTLDENLKDSNLRLRDSFHIFLYKSFFSYNTESDRKW